MAGVVKFDHAPVTVDALGHVEYQEVGKTVKTVQGGSGRCSPQHRMHHRDPEAHSFPGGRPSKSRRRRHICLSSVLVSTWTSAQAGAPLGHVLLPGLFGRRVRGSLFLLQVFVVFLGVGMSQCLQSAVHAFLRLLEQDRRAVGVAVGALASWSTSRCGSMVGFRLAQLVEIDW